MTTAYGEALAIPARDLVSMIEVAEDGQITFGGTTLRELDTDDRLALRAQALVIAANLHAFSRAIEGSIAADMVEEGASELFHPDYEITYAPRKVDPVVNAELLYTELTKFADAGKCDPAQVAKAVQRTETVTFRANRTYLKPFYKLGGDFVRVLKAGIVESEPGAPVFSIKAKARR